MHDLIVIGGGIVGLATAERYLRTHPGHSLLLLEQGPRLCGQQSGRNSGVLHSGIYYEPGSLKARGCLRGKQLMQQFCREMGVPFKLCGKLIVATHEGELQRLAELERRGLANGVELRRLEPQEIKTIEPGVRGVAALHVPQTGVVDFALVGEALGQRVREAGGELRLDTRVQGVRSHGARIEVTLASGVEFAHRAVVCAGLQADRLARAAGLVHDVRIVPFRGDYYALREPHAAQVHGLVYPVPDPRFPFLGVHLTRRSDGVVEAGPNAVLALSRERAGRFAFSGCDALDALSWPGLWRLMARHGRMGLRELWRSSSARAFAAEARRLLPALRSEWLERVPSGVRAQLLDSRGQLIDDFVFERDGAVLHLLNAPSPAATSALAIAELLVEEIA